MKLASEIYRGILVKFYGVYKKWINECKDNAKKIMAPKSFFSIHYLTPIVMLLGYILIKIDGMLYIKNNITEHL